MIAAAVKRVLASLNESAGKSGTVNPASTAGGLDAKKDYPLAIKRRDLVKSATGLALDAITLDKVVEGKIGFDDMKIHPDTLEYQAQIAISAGRPHIAKNLRRAAELTRIPDARVLEIYNALRPYRSTRQQLLDIADELETKYQAKICAGFVREALAVYEKRGRIKK
ncbi:MAG: propanediol dehydratase small subunit PduE [Acidobacteria bacterium]|nr:MAG: propanediol dehydratase small subunit PduE [Acidobacteriota bacterium]